LNASKIEEEYESQRMTPEVQLIYSNLEIEVQKIEFIYTSNNKSA
jgi:hypothetical protein